jgi:hypothetical protein
MNRENPLWGAPRIHGELLLLGFSVAQAIHARPFLGGLHHQYVRMQ